MENKHQIKPRCPYYGSCGGCQLQHLPYEAQLQLKRELVKEALTREGLGEVEVRKTLGMVNPWFYRNKVQFPIRCQNNRLQIGYFRRRTHEVVNIKECYIQDPFLTEIAQIAREVFEERKLSAYNEKTGEGLLRHFIGRSAQRTEEALLGIVINGKGMPSAFSVADEIKRRERLANRLAARHADYEIEPGKRKIVGIIQNSNTARGNTILGTYNTTLLGGQFLLEKLGRFSFHVRLASFFQVNPFQAERLYDLVERWSELTGEERVVDAYAGIGTIAFWVARGAKEVLGIEERPAAVKDATENATLNKMTNIKMKIGLVEKLFPKSASVAILDPPRGGCAEKALERVVKAGPRLVIYVSCNPKSLARDLKILVREGYEIERIQPIDMFPQTEHVEVAVKLKRSS